MLSAPWVLVVITGERMNVYPPRITAVNGER